MKYSEAEKQIKALSSKYDVDFYAHKFNVYYKNELTAGVKKNFRYSFINRENIFKKLPFGNKLYMILAELAITPLDERVEEKKYCVHVFKGQSGYLNIVKSRFTVDDKVEFNGIKTKFTDKEISQLKQRDDIPLDWGKVRFEEANWPGLHC